jgi:hypothetical protein
MELKDFRALLTPSGREALQAAITLEPRETDFLRDFTHLSRLFPPDLARAALETAILRGEAAGKFRYADKMYFTREALEQATPWEVSTYRVTRFRSFERLADLGCSIGGDSLVMGEMAETFAIDRDILRLEMAAANSRALNLDGNIAVIQADLMAPLPFSRRARLGLFFDPARRAMRGRIKSVKDYLPPLAIVHDWLTHHPAIGVKISPAVNLHELRSFDAEIEFISLGGELKEATLWFGPLKTAKRRATILPGAYTLAEHDSMPAEKSTANGLPIDEPRAFLFEPDPAVMRAGLVEKLGNDLGAVQLDADIAYLTSDRQVATPFARDWRVEDWMPFSLKRLRSVLRERGVGRVVVKKRGSPIQPEYLIRALRLAGEEERVLFLTHLRGRPIAIICFPN